MSERAEPYRVLVVEDEPVALEAHAAYVERVPGFVVAATASTSQAALRALQQNAVDVVLLDMVLPDRHGLDVIRAMRAGGHTADVIAVTSARDLEVVRAAASMGVVQYLLKPFVFATLRDRLEAYRAFRDQLGDASQVSTQAEVDEVLAGGRHRVPAALPKGMSEELLAKVSTALRAAPGLVDRAGRRRGGQPGDRPSVRRVPLRGQARAAEPAVCRRRPPRGGVPLGGLTVESLMGLGRSGGAGPSKTRLSRRAP